MKPLRKKYTLLFSRCNNSSGMELHQNRCLASRRRLTCVWTAYHACMPSSNLSTLLKRPCRGRSLMSSQQLRGTVLSMKTNSDPGRKQVSELSLQDSYFAHRIIRRPVSYSKGTRLSLSPMWKLHRFTKQSFLYSWCITAKNKAIKKGTKGGKMVCNLEATLYLEWLPNSRMSANLRFFFPPQYKVSLVFEELLF